MIRTICLLAAMLALTACGFRPLYAGAAFDGTGSSQIQVDEINDRSGYLLRRELMKELAIGLPGLDETGRLKVRLSEQLERITLLNDGSVSRSFLEGEASYVLTLQGGRTYQGKSQVQIPIAATRSLYGDVAAQTQSSERGMDELARKIVDDLRIQVQAGQ